MSGYRNGRRAKRRGPELREFGLTLTESAQEHIDRYVDSARYRLLRELASIQRRSLEPRVLRSEDVESAIRELANADRTTYSRDLRRRLAKNTILTIAFAALVVSAIGGFYWAASSDSGAKPFWVGLVVSVPLSVAANLLTPALSSYLQRRTSAKKALDRELLRRFAQMEQELRAFVASASSDDIAAGQLSDVFQVVQEAGVWSEEDTQSFRQLLLLRNALVHEKRLSADSADFTNALHTIDRLRGLIPPTPSSRSFTSM